MGATLLFVAPDQEGGVLDFAKRLIHELARDSTRALLLRLGQRRTALAGVADSVSRSWNQGHSALPEILGELAREIQLAGVVLHYVGYGFHARGAPMDLSRAWKEAREALPEVRFGVHFHELYAFGPPWRSSFWLRPLQRRIVRTLLLGADAAVTSLPRYQGELRRLVANRPVIRLPIPSTVGEPTSMQPFAARPNRLVLFGSAGLRARAYRTEAEALVRAVETLGIEEIVDLGAGDMSPELVAGVPVRRSGRVPAARVRRLLGDSRFGFLAYPPEYLDKSTVFGAYLAHGLVPICAWSGPRGREPRADEAWCRASGRSLNLTGEPADFAAACAARYADRALARHAEAWRSMLLTA